MTSTATIDSPPQLGLDTIHQGDCLQLLAQLQPGSIDLVFADPPFNIGYDYDEYHDKRSDEDYLDWSKKWMAGVYQALKPSGTFWLSIGDEYAAELKVMAEKKLGFSTRSWVIWYYTFGVNCKNKFSRSHAHIFQFVKDPEQFTFNAEDPFVRVPSARALVYGDKRANPKGRLPDDTWILRPQDLPDGFDSMDSTWYFARVAGTFKERQGFHGCQMPEQLLGRIIRVSSQPGELVLDPFAGSGTTLAVAKKLKRRFVGFELSADYVKFASERVEAAWPGQKLDGPADAVGSAPATADGKRLKTQPLLPGFVADDFPEPIPVITEELLDMVVEEAPPLEEKPKKTSAKTKPEESKTVSRPTTSVDLRTLIDETLIHALESTGAPTQIDWFLADVVSQEKFHAACRLAGLLGSPVDWNRAVLQLAKNHKLPKPTKKLPRPSEKTRDPLAFAAEMAWRYLVDKTDEPSLEVLLCDPVHRQSFDKQAKRLAPGCDLQLIRLAGLALEHDLPKWEKDAHKYHFVLSTRDFHHFQSWSKLSLKKLQGVPGLYFLRGAKKLPLYIGQTDDLGKRLELQRQSKLEGATHISLLTDEELPSADYRQALWVKLVRQYAPKWNR